MSETNNFWRESVVPISSNIEEAISVLNNTGLKIVLVVNEIGQLDGTISDGDIRRGLLKGLNIGDSTESIINRNCLVAPIGMGRELVMQLMQANKVHQVPIVDAKYRIVGLHLWDEITNPINRENVMVIMAGGLGTRLRPQTEYCPKPMLPVAGKPMLEHIIDRAKLEGFKRFILAIHYLGWMIEEHFGDGSRFGINIQYLREETPLGTAGALALLNPKPVAPFVVTNGDVISDIRYGELIDFHVQYSAVATMAVRVYEWQHPYGVVQTNGIDIVGFEEKPTMRDHVNAGIYVLNPIALDSLVKDTRCDMPSLFQSLQSNSSRVLAYPMHEPWLDVGRPTDYEQAEKTLSNRR